MVITAADNSVVMCTQVTSGCFGYLSTADRQVRPARDLIDALDTTYCADTVGMECFADSYVVFPSAADHHERMQRWSQPMCQILQGSASAERAVRVVSRAEGALEIPVAPESSSFLVMTARDHGQNIWASPTPGHPSDWRQTRAGEDHAQGWP